jgi:hypothetical protein
MSPHTAGRCKMSATDPYQQQPFSERPVDDGLVCSDATTFYGTSVCVTDRPFAVLRSLMKQLRGLEYFQ